MASILRPLVENLEDRHRRALEWFDDHAGRVVPWPGTLADGTHLATKAKGIYKPRWSKYSLSVRQSLDGPYPDMAVQQRDDGTWTFGYYQEGFDPDQAADSFTNVGLLECLRDVVPVGVFVQVMAKPNPRYRVLGLALVSGYEAGYFYLEGNEAVVFRDSGAVRDAHWRQRPQERADAIAAAFAVRDIKDERERTLRLINERRGQPGFRRTLLDAYGRRCAVTGYDAPESLEAAHISPYRGPVTNHPSNGILLRGDVHTLFDLGLLTVDYDSRTLVLGPELQHTRYGALAGERLSFPEDGRLHPSRDALALHRERSGL